MGEGRYRPLLCLVQVAVERAGRRRGPGRGARPARATTSTPAPLADVLADPEVEIVFHAGRQDVALLRRVWAHRGDATSSTRRSPPGSPGRRAQLGYEALLSELLGVRLRKSASFTRWDARPLSDEQVALRARGRAAPARARRRAPAASSTSRGRLGVGARGVPRARGRLRRARPPTRSSPACRASTRSTRRSAPSRASSSQWREETARRRRTGRCQSVLADAALVEIAKRRPEGPRPAAPDPRAQRGHAAPPRQGDPRRGRARPRAAADPRRRRAPAAAATRATPR